MQVVHEGPEWTELCDGDGWHRRDDGGAPLALVGPCWCPVIGRDAVPIDGDEQQA